MSNIGGRFFGVVMRVDSLMECCLGELTGSIKDVVVVEMVGGDCWERGIGWLGGVIGGSSIGAADSLRMDVGDSGRGDGGSAIMGGGGACVGSGMVSERDYCRIPGVTWELWEDLPYNFQFFFQIPS